MVAAFADPRRYVLGNLACRQPGYKSTGKPCEPRSAESVEVQCVDVLE